MLVRFCSVVITTIAILIVLSARVVTAQDYIQVQEAVWQHGFGLAYQHERHGLLVDPSSFKGNEWTVLAYQKDPDEELGSAQFVLGTQHRSHFHDYLPEDFFEQTGTLEVEFSFVSGRFANVGAFHITVFVTRWVVPDPKGGDPHEFVTFVPFATGTQQAMEERAAELAGETDRTRGPIADLCRCGDSPMPEEIERLLNPGIIREETNLKRQCESSCRRTWGIVGVAYGVVTGGATVACIWVTAGIGAKVCVAAGTATTGLGLGAVAIAYNGCMNNCKGVFCGNILSKSAEYYESKYQECIEVLDPNHPACRFWAERRDQLNTYIQVCTTRGPGACVSSKLIAMLGIPAW